LKKLGSSVSGLKVGDKIALFPLTGCKKCHFCLTEQEHLCPTSVFYGSAIQGGFSNYVLADFTQAISYSSIQPTFAATCCCSGITTYSALKKIGHLTETSKVVFIGAGGLGLMALELFKTIYPSHPGPIFLDIDDAKLKMALENGASETMNIEKENVKVKELASKSWTGNGIVAVLDFVGSTQTVSTGISLLSKGGKLIIVGLYGGGMKLPIPVFPLKAISIHGNYLGSLQEFKELMQIVSQGKVTAPPITVRSFSEADQTIQDLRNGKIVGRVVLQIDPNSSL